MSGADGAGESVDGIGEKLLEFFEALLAAIGDDRIRKKCADDEGGPCDGGIPGVEDGGESGANAAEHAEQEKISGAEFHARLQEGILHGGDAGGAAEQSVECGDLAELFIAEQGEFFVGFALRSLLDGSEAVFDKAGAGVALVEQGEGGEGHEGDDDEDENCDQERHERLGIFEGLQSESDKDASQTREHCVAKSATHRAARPDPSLRKRRLLRMTILFFFAIFRFGSLDFGS